MAGNLGGAAMVTVIGVLKDAQGSFAGGVVLATVLALVVTAVAATVPEPLGGSRAAAATEPSPYASDRLPRHPSQSRHPAGLRHIRLHEVRHPRPWPGDGRPPPRRPGTARARRHRHHDAHLQPRLAATARLRRRGDRFRHRRQDQLPGTRIPTVTTPSTNQTADPRRRGSGAVSGGSHVR